MYYEYKYIDIYIYIYVCTDIVWDQTLWFSVTHRFVCFGVFRGSLGAVGRICMYLQNVGAKIVNVDDALELRLQHVTCLQHFGYNSSTRSS